MADNPNQTTNLLPNIQELTRKAQSIYNTLDPEFIKQNNGKYIAIDVDSGEHFIGDTREEAVKAAHTKYPGKLTFIRRIGILEKVSRQFSSVLNHNYDSLL